MKLSAVSTLTALFALLITPALRAGDKAPAGKNVKVTWKRQVVDKVFRSEGVAVADVNKDGKADIITGDVWYEAPSWKMHVLSDQRKFNIKGWDPMGYSESFGAFPDDFNGDGWIDVIVAPFPGKECYWYENPGSKGGSWKQHLLTNSACNETPIYVDLFGKGKKHLVMGWQPPGKNTEGELCYFVPGKDPTQPWQRISISGPSDAAKKIEQPGTQRFSHGLGHGDVNGDGRIDIIVPQGWWEQPAQVDGTPWTFHPASLGPACADMYTFDMDGDGKNDIISSSAHLYGFWWFQQKTGKDHPLFVQHELFPAPDKVAKLPKDHGLSADELALYNAINKARNDQKRAPWKLNPALVAQARGAAQSLEKPETAKSSYQGDVRWTKLVRADASATDVVQPLLPSGEKDRVLSAPRLEIGVAVAKGQDGKATSVLILGDSGQFSLPSQTHAMHFVDINGDGQKDLVTGRRWWAHGPKGDAGPNDPAYVYWFEARKNKDGFTTFIPHEVDDDSGIGTQFAVEDINGDGIPDIVISNKRGVYVLVQVRTPVDATPKRND